MATQEDLVFALKARDEASATFDKVKESSGVAAKSAADQWKKASQTIGKAFTGFGLAITGTLALSTKAAADFDGAMREVNTMMLLNEETYADFSQEVRDMAVALGVDAVEASQALYQVISAGVPKENAIDFLTIASKAAIGGVTDTETAVDGLTTVMNAFKIPITEVQSVADLMFTTVKGGKTTFDELSASLFQVAPMAATAGVGFDEVSAALATMTKQGVPTNVATTQLRQSIQAMIKPTEDMKAAIADAGYASGEALIENEGLSGALTLLRDASEGSNEVLGKMFGSVEGLSAVLALTGENAGTFADDLAAMADSTGAATDAFNQMEQSTGRQLDTLKASFSEIAMSIGDVVLPILKGLFDQIKPVIDKVIEWTKDNPQLTKTIVIVAGVIGVLMTVLGPLLLMLPTLMTAFTVLSGPIGLVTLAIMALIAIGVAVWQNWDTIRVKTIEIWGAISDFFKGIWDKIVGFFKDNWDKILAILFPAVGIPILIARHWEPIVSFFSDIWEKVKGIFSNAWDGIVGIVKGSVNAVLDFINGMIGGVEAGINAVIGMINKFRLVFPGLEILGKQIIPAFEWGLPEIPTMNLPRIPLLDTGGLVQGPGLFGVGAGVKEIVRTPGTGVTINAVNIYAETAEGGRRAGQGFFEEMQRRGIRLSGMYA